MSLISLLHYELFNPAFPEDYEYSNAEDNEYYVDLDADEKLKRIMFYSMPFQRGYNKRRMHIKSGDEVVLDVQMSNDLTYALNIQWRIQKAIEMIDEKLPKFERNHPYTRRIIIP